MNIKLLLLVFLMPIVAMAAPLTSQQGDLILQEIRQIRQLLERQQAHPVAMPAEQVRQLFDPKSTRPVPTPTAQAPQQSIKLNISGAPALGQSDASVVMAMYTDYECPFCRRFDIQTFPEIRKQFIVPGKLKFVVIDAPLDSHANARKAAEATKCAADQNHYWDFREKLSIANEPLDTARLKSYANEIGLDGAGFDQCMSSGKYSKMVADSVVEASRQGVSGTPTFVIGIEKGGVVEGVHIVGAQPYAVFEQKLNEYLEKNK
jgi:protein-disulfide isomerase